MPTPTGAGLTEFDAHETHARLAHHEAVLVDVREPAEFAADHISGAVNLPLSRFDPAALPGDPARVILQCGAGKRSAMAWEACHRAGVPVAGHLKGGLAAWKAAGLPTTR